MNKIAFGFALAFVGVMEVIAILNLVLGPKIG